MATYNPKWILNLTNLANKYLSPEIARKIRPQLKSIDFKTLFANEVIDKMVENTQDGVDKNEKPFKAYSKSYSSSEVFKIYKGSQKTVDMTLTGSMLSSLDSKLSGDSITIFFNDKEDAAKAHGHINGTKTLPKRDFFGLPEDELKNLFQVSVRQFLEGERDESGLILARDVLNLEEE